MKTMRIIIIEDESKIRKSLINVLKLHYPLAEVVAEAEDVISGVAAIKLHQPDVILLDINMPGGTGFELLDHFKPLTFKVIFITAFDQFALQAFKFSATDYLLKPVIPQELVDALNKTAEPLTKEDSNTKMDVFQHNLSALNRDHKKIVINTQQKMHVLNISEIVHCHAHGNYTEIYLSDGEKIVASKPIKEFEEMLLSFDFFRCHHSDLVNLHLIEKLDKKAGGLLIMKNGIEVAVSVRKHPELIIEINRVLRG